MDAQTMFNPEAILSRMLETMDASILVLLVILFILGSIFINYLFASIGHYRFNKYTRYNNSWMAFLPVIRPTGIFEWIADEDGSVDIFGIKIHNILCLFVPMILSTVSIVPYIGSTMYFILFEIFGTYTYGKAFAKLNKGLPYVLGFFCFNVPIVFFIYSLFRLRGVTDVCKYITDEQYSYSNETNVDDEIIF